MPGKNSEQGREDGRSLASAQQDARLAAAQWLSRLATKKQSGVATALSKKRVRLVKDELIKTLENSESGSKNYSIATS
jgi:hypothetical protein